MKKIVIIGCGNVGMSYAYSLLNSDLHFDELVLIDINKEKAEGEALDLLHATAALNKKISIKAGEYCDCNDADIVCICAGKNQNVGETRDDLVFKNTQVFSGIIENINRTKFDGIYLVATNPLDVMTYVTFKLSGFDNSRVIGSGTVLDTARLRDIISRKLDINPKNIHAFVLGEHGDFEFIAWSNAFIGLNKADTYFSLNEKKKILADVRQSAYEIINKKGNTSYGIGVCLKNITKAIFEKSKTVLTVSCYDKKNDCYVAMPATIGRGGIEKVFDVNLNKQEKLAYEKSIKNIKSVLEKVDFN